MRRNGERAREATVSDEQALGVRQNDERDAGRNEVNAVIVPYVRCDGIRRIGSETVAEMMVLGANESSNSWTS